MKTKVQGDQQVQVANIEEEVSQYQDQYPQESLDGTFHL
jgi:hypothetical protein